MEILPAFANVPQHIFTVVLGSRSYRYRRTYKSRLGAWYVDVMNRDDTLIVGGRRLNGGSFPLENLAVDFEGVLYVHGSDVYLRTDLGADLYEVHISTDELGAAAPDYQEVYA